MSMLPDDIYDVFIVDARADDHMIDITHLDLAITTGEHKGDVINVAATNLRRDVIDLIGLPARLRVTNGTPVLEFD